MWKTQAHIHFYAPLLLSDMKWEVAYSTLCTEFFFFFRKLYINLHMAGLHFHKLDLWQHSHTKHTNTQTYVNQIWEECMTAAVSERLDPLALESRGGGVQPDICRQRRHIHLSEQVYIDLCPTPKHFFYFFFPCLLHLMHHLIIRYQLHG